MKKKDGKKQFQLRDFQKQALTREQQNSIKGGNGDGAEESANIVTVEILDI